MGQFQNMMNCLKRHKPSVWYQTPAMEALDRLVSKLKLTKSSSSTSYRAGKAKMQHASRQQTKVGFKAGSRTNSNNVNLKKQWNWIESLKVSAVNRVYKPSPPRLRATMILTSKALIDQTPRTSQKEWVAYLAWVIQERAPRTLPMPTSLISSDHDNLSIYIDK